MDRASQLIVSVCACDMYCCLQVEAFATRLATDECEDDPAQAQPPAAPGQRRLLDAPSAAIALIRGFCPTDVNVWLTPEMTVVEAESVILQALRQAVGVDSAVTISLPLYLRLSDEWLPRDMKGTLKDLHIKQPWKLTYSLTKPRIPAIDLFKAAACQTVRRMAEQLQCGGL